MCSLFGGENEVFMILTIRRFRRMTEPNPESSDIRLVMMLIAGILNIATSLFYGTLVFLILAIYEIF